MSKPKILRDSVNLKPHIYIYLESLAYSFLKVTASEGLHIH